MVRARPKFWVTDPLCLRAPSTWRGPSPSNKILVTLYVPVISNVEYQCVYLCVYQYQIIELYCQQC